MIITQEEFLQRRTRFFSFLNKKTVAIIPSAREQFRTGDATYPFRQNNDFYYLTGFNEPDAIAVFHTLGKEPEYILFNRPLDPEKAMWDGQRVGQARAVSDYKADSAYPIEKFAEKMSEILESCECLYYKLDHIPSLDQTVFEIFRKIKGKRRYGQGVAECILSTDLILHEMRLFKSKAEIVAMRRAAHITADAHLRAMKKVKAGLFEYQIEAEMAFEIFNQGARSFAYEPILAAGANACVLHYRENDAALKENELLLMDVGAEYQHYASDVTRTIPISGRFTAEQKAIYELVLRAQEAVIDLIRPQLPWNAMQLKVVEVLTEGLIELGLLKGKREALIENKAHLPFYMHSSGHWIGMDVHDVGRYRIEEEWRKLNSDMVLTVEPGLYIAPHNQDVPEKWRGIGIRIEDVVLVTESGSDILSKALPKKIDEIESLMRKEHV